MVWSKRIAIAHLHLVGMSGVPSRDSWRRVRRDAPHVRAARGPRTVATDLSRSAPARPCPSRSPCRRRGGLRAAAGTGLTIFEQFYRDERTMRSGTGEGSLEHRKDAMTSLIAAAGALWIAVIMWDAFEAIVLPRRVTRRLRPARLFYRVTWRLWSAVARRMRPGGRRETFLSFYGPLSLLVLLAAWAASLVTAFAMVQAGIGTRLNVTGDGAFLDHLYMSGETFFTLGLGDVTPTSRAGRAVMVIEAGVGFGFLALVIGDLPVLYQSFSRREMNITLLDARAGSPSSATEMLRRHAESGNLDELGSVLREWERWAAELLESHLSYPVLCYFRSQHDNQSWVAALTTVLDTCALVMVGVEGLPA